MDRGIVMADADVLVDYLLEEGAAARIAELARRRRLGVSTVAAFEVWCGTRTMPAQRSFRALLRVSRVYPLDKPTAERAGQLYRERQAVGARMAQRDTLIAAAVIVQRVPLLTRNGRHFEGVPGLKLQVA